MPAVVVSHLKTVENVSSALLHRSEHIENSSVGLLAWLQHRRDSFR